MARGNAMLARIEATAEAKYAALFQAKMEMLFQIAQDAACCAENDVLKMGAGRAEPFCHSYERYVKEIFNLMDEDQRNDDEYEYAKAKVDGRIKSIVGADKFSPWDERYRLTSEGKARRL